jgi:hypothetical protein
MRKVLLINHPHIQCGVFQFMQRIYTIVSKSKNIDFQYRIVSNHDEYVDAINVTSPDYVLYNWHFDRLPFIKDIDIVSRPEIKHYFIYHDGSMIKTYDKYLVFGAMPPDTSVFKEGGAILMPRPLYEYTGEYPVNNVPTIGSFGFAFNHKKFHEIAPFIAKHIGKAIVNLHFTNPYFGDTPGNKIQDIIDLCHRVNTNPNVKLNITTNFLGDNSLLEFLAGNDLNIFMYDKDLQNPGISSAIDYALSVKRPIAISDNMMFRHIASDEILLTKTNINNIIENGTKPLEKFYAEWSTDNFILEMEKVFNE